MRSRRGQKQFRVGIKSPAVGSIDVLPRQSVFYALSVAKNVDTDDTNVYIRDENNSYGRKPRCAVGLVGNPQLFWNTENNFRQISKPRTGNLFMGVEVPEYFYYRVLIANAVDMIQSIVRHLNTANVDAMAQKAIAVPVKNKRELDEIASLIHKRALTSPNFVKLYAKLCAELVNSGFNGRVGLGSAFREVLLPKCHDAFVEACKILTATESGELSNRKTTYYVANCEFIGELFNLDVIPKDTAWSYLNELMSENGGHLQMQCQCALLKTAAPKLSKSYSMTRAVGQLLVLRNNAFRNEELPPTLTDLIEDIKYMYLMNWVHESPDELAMRRLYDDDALESFDYNLMSECIYDECWDLLFIYAYNGHSDEGNGFERFLTPVLNSLLRHNRTSFLAAFILAALGVEDDIIRTYAGRLLAALVNAKRLSKFDVVSRFDQILLDEETNAACIYIPDLMNSIRNAFEELLN